MIPVVQRIIGTGGADGNDVETIGDCFKASVCSILERDYDDVPHFVRQEVEEGRGHIWIFNDWLKAEGYPFQVEQWYAPGDFFAEREEPIRMYHADWYLATVKSKMFEGSFHSVVCNHGQVMHDPNPNYGTPEYDKKPYDYLSVTYFYHPEPWKAKHETSSD